MQPLEHFLQTNASQFSDKTAVCCGENSVTYAQLWQRVEAEAEMLGSNEERAMVMRASQSIDFLVRYFAIHVAGKVAVPLEKDVPQERLEEIQAIVGSSVISDDVADVLFTTGTTGRSKGTMLSHRAIIADAENLIYAQGFCSETNFIINGPLNHIGSLSKVWPIIIVGGTLHITDGMKSMDDFFHALDSASSMIATFLVPASIRMLLHFGASRLGEYASVIDFIETGAAPMAQADMETLCSILPHTRLYNTYASTETGIISTYDYNSGECLAGCLGRPMKHSRIIITPEGNVSCQGDTLMSGYIGDEQHTSAVLHDDTVFTADKGYLDEHGRLRLTGREGDVINIGGFKIAPTEVEDAAMSFPEVSDCICISATHPVLGTALRLLVVTKDNQPLSKKPLALHLSSLLERYKVPQFYTQVSEIKRTYNGKLDRKAYREER